MNILHLKYAIMVSETGSISKAAEKLFVAQPNVSRAIKELENDLNITIFERNAKGMVVTAEGERLIMYGKRILRDFDELEKSFRGQKNKNIFSISVPRASYISKAFVKFSEVMKKMNNVEMYYKETNAYRAINNILNEDYKLGIIRYPVAYDKYFKELLEKKDLRFQLLNEFNYTLIFSKSSPLAKIDKITVNDLKSLIEISHADPYVPSFPVSELSKNEYTDEVGRRIFIFERGSQFELLENNPNTFMWVSPVPSDILEKYNLMEKNCEGATKSYKDLLICRSSYTFTTLDKEFITLVCESKRDVTNK